MGDLEHHSTIASPQLTDLLKVIILQLSHLLLLGQKGLKALPLLLIKLQLLQLLLQGLQVGPAQRRTQVSTERQLYPAFLHLWAKPTGNPRKVLIGRVLPHFNHPKGLSYNRALLLTTAASLFKKRRLWISLNTLKVYRRNQDLLKVRMSHLKLLYKPSFKSLIKALDYCKEATLPFS